MSKYQFKPEILTDENIVVHCPEHWQAKALLKWAHENGKKWGSGVLSYLKEDYWDRLKENTCYNLYSGEFSLIGYYKWEENYTILSFEDAILDSKLNTGLKYDSDKPRYDLTPFHALHEVVRVLTQGAKKYGDQNWRKVDNLNARYLGASMRHEYAFQCGETKDEETGLHPLAHKICSDMFRLEDELLKEASVEDVLTSAPDAYNEDEYMEKKQIEIDEKFKNSMGKINPDTLGVDTKPKPRSDVMVYIASPYTIGDKLDNVNNSLVAWNILVSHGFTPIAPLLSHYIDERYKNSPDFWYAYDLKILERCDCVLRLSGKSKGADMEVEFAKENNIPVFYNYDKLSAYYPKGE